MNDADLGQADALGGMGQGALAALVGMAVLLTLPVLAVAALLSDGSAARETNGAAAASSVAAAAIPSDQFAVMQQVGQQSGIPWQVFAAIAKVESDFGRNMATSSAGAIGYGQFLPSTWASFGRGGNPYDYRDVIPAMARYLLAFGAPADLRRAVYAYNHDWGYVNQVLALAAAYGLGNDAAVAAPAGIAARIVALALAQRGKPYVFGAAGPDAFDCSGLVQWVFRQVGITAPRTAQAQFAWTRALRMAELAPGDLLFFERTYPSPDRVTHVGIYAGDGRMVVAPQVGEAVRLEPLDTPFWRAHFVGAGRPPVIGTALAHVYWSSEAGS